MKNINSNKQLLIFDFDHTISSADSFIEFSIFSLNILKLIKYWISVLFFFPFKQRSYIKEMFFKNFEDFTLVEFNEHCKSFVKKKVKPSIKESFKDFLQISSSNREIIIVSASISNYLKPWCDEMGFDLISTELETVNGKLTGKFSTPNCNGQEKVRRIKEKYDLSEYDEIHVFGNSKGDFPMLELGTHKYYKFFK